MPDVQEVGGITEAPQKRSTFRIVLLALAAVAIVVNIVLFYQNTKAKRAIAYACGYTAGMVTNVAETTFCAEQRLNARDYGFYGLRP